MGRKTILAFIFVIILAIAGILYFYFFGKTPTTPNSIGGYFKTILPFSNTPTTNPNTDNDTPLILGGDNTQTSSVASLPRLRHYTTEPTAGDTIIESERDVIKDRIKVKEKQIQIRYIDRATGHIFDINTNEESPEKISNTTIPKIYEASFFNSGSSLIARFLDNSDNILTYYINLKEKTQPKISTSTTATTTNTVASKKAEEQKNLKAVAGTYLTKNIRELALSPTGKKILDLTYVKDGGLFSVVSINESVIKSDQTILAHPLREWLLSYPTESTAIITTKPSGVSYGYSYILDTAKGSLTNLVGNIVGLTILPHPSLNIFLVGEASDSLALSIYSKKDSSLLPLSLKTLPEKCVWSKTDTDTVFCAIPKNIRPAIYPDDWYTGVVEFNDSLWKINTKTGQTTLISNLSTEGGQLTDATNLQISSTDQYITFINKRDLTLWGVDLTIK